MRRCELLIVRHSENRLQDLLFIACLDRERSSEFRHRLLQEPWGQ